MFSNQLSIARTERGQPKEYAMPDTEAIHSFADKAREKLKGLNFQAKKVIVGTLIDKVVGNQEELVVSGYIPLEYLENHASFITSHRNRRIAECREVDVV